MILTGCNSGNTPTPSPDPEPIEPINPGDPTHEHTFDDLWDFDDINHWHPSTCGHNVKKDEGKHIFSDYFYEGISLEYDTATRVRECTVCVYREKLEIEHFSTNHEHVVGKTERVDITEATCTECGQYELISYCEYCGVEMKKEHINVPELGHDLIHHESKAPTCMETGYGEYESCSRCDYTTKVEIPPTGHIHTATREENKVEATCTEDGQYDLVTYCLDDGAIISRETKIIKSTGHVWIHEEAKAATCTEAGWGEYDVCSICGYSTKVEIPATGHIHIETKEIDKVEATCTEDGSYTLVTYCVDDNVEISRETKTIKALGHDLVSHIAKEATCTEAGYAAYQTCSRCDYTTKEEIPAVGHDYDEPTYVWNDDHSKCTASAVCKHGCGEKLEETVSSQYVVEEEATGSKDGIANYVATFQSKEFETQHFEVKIPATGTLDKLLFTLVDSYYEVKASSTEISGDVVIPSTYDDKPVKTIADFKNCKDITTLYFEGEDFTINNAAFSGCTSLTTVNLINKGDGRVSIGGGSFSSCVALSSFTCKSTKIYLSAQTFMSCTSLVNFITSDDLTILSMSEKTFYDCKLLLSLPKVYMVGKQACYNCQSLQDVTFSDGDGATTIGEEAFFQCSSLKSINIPTKTKYINKYAFGFCESLESVSIPDTVTSIYENAFYYCSSLQSITLPKGITTIRQETFKRCFALKDVVIQEGVTSIGKSAFEECTSLSDVYLPNSLTEIGETAFYKCGNIGSMRIGPNITSISYSSFINSSPNEVYYFGDING